MLIYSRRIYPFLHSLPTLINYYGLFHLPRRRRHRRWSGTEKKEVKHNALPPNNSFVEQENDSGREEKRKWNKQTFYNYRSSEVQPRIWWMRNCRSSICEISLFASKTRQKRTHDPLGLIKRKFSFCARDAGIRCASRLASHMQTICPTAYECLGFFFLVQSGCH